MKNLKIMFFIEIMCFIDHEKIENYVHQIQNVHCKTTCTWFLSRSSCYDIVKIDYKYSVSCENALIGSMVSIQCDWSEHIKPHYARSEFAEIVASRVVYRKQEEKYGNLTIT